MEIRESGTSRLFGSAADSRADTWEVESQFELDSAAYSESRSGVGCNGVAPRSDLQGTPHWNLRKMAAHRNHEVAGSVIRAEAGRWKPPNAWELPDSIEREEC